MNLSRLLVLGALILLLTPAPRTRADELPATARRLIENAQRDIDRIEKDAEEAARKAKAAVAARRKKLIESLETLEATLKKEAKFALAKAVHERLEEVKFGKVNAQPDPGTLSNHRGQAGKPLFFEVTAHGNGSLWGTGIYTDDSTLATVAVHAGILRVGEKGIIKVTLLPGQGAYQASVQNGISSGGWGAWTGSYKVELVRKLVKAAPKPPAPAPVPAPVPRKPGQPRVLPDPGSGGGLRGQNGKTFLFSVTARAGGSVWGTDVYTDDSALATVVLHTGLLKAGQTGTVRVTILAGQEQYVGCTRNGVTSSDYGNWGGSFAVELVGK
jgi:LCCL domain